MVKADEVKVGPHSIIAVPGDDCRPHAAFLSFSEAFAYSRQKRSAGVQLSLSSGSMSDDGFPINRSSGQLLEMCHRIESAGRGAATANCGQPVVESKVRTVLA